MEGHPHLRSRQAEHHTAAVEPVAHAGHLQLLLCVAQGTKAIHSSSRQHSAQSSTERDGRGAQLSLARKDRTTWHCNRRGAHLGVAMDRHPMTSKCSYSAHVHLEQLACCTQPLAAAAAAIGRVAPEGT